jgi:hypothetical protein
MEPLTLPTSVMIVFSDRKGLSFSRNLLLTATGAHRNIISQSAKRSFISVVPASIAPAASASSSVDCLRAQAMICASGQICLIASAMEPPINPRLIKPNLFMFIKYKILSEFCSSVLYIS